ncbi:MAG TPA: hypothetical protein PLJ42_01755 [Chitinophagales bacterium]|jgi:hypothetical protein|nr:hypothetical protein [Chitinophagales bacterium]MBP6154445.1 hypothetical protein [Chitinophagales bacterium]HQV77656.1 hypothetical protein [Chitinophagales bacterium]HQW78129.1 hypothetical protein [Chitinophagales bacterium]HRB66976.1 hypothetical protein [Chitinophagales bacterium]
MFNPIYSSAEIVSILACGIYFMIGLLTGVWKYIHIMKSKEHQAPVYVDIAHRAALMYAFACLVLLAFVQISQLTDIVELIAASSVILFFGSAIVTYIILGITNHTDNQFKQKNIITTFGMYLLIAGEVGGFAVLLFGAVQHILR